MQALPWPAQRFQERSIMASLVSRPGSLLSKAEAFLWLLVWICGLGTDHLANAVTRQSELLLMRSWRSTSHRYRPLDQGDPAPAGNLIHSSAPVSVFQCVLDDILGRTSKQGGARWVVQCHQGARLDRERCSLPARLFCSISRLVWSLQIYVP